MNPVAMTIVSLRKEYWPSWDQTGFLYISPVRYHLSYLGLAIGILRPLRLKQDVMQGFDMNISCSISDCDVGFGMIP